MAEKKHRRRPSSLRSFGQTRQSDARRRTERRRPSGAAKLDIATGGLDSEGIARMAEPLKYTVVIEHSETGYGAYVPDLPGCGATGRPKLESGNASERQSKYTSAACARMATRFRSPLPPRPLLKWRLKKVPERSLLYREGDSGLRGNTANGRHHLGIATGKVRHRHVELIEARLHQAGVLHGGCLTPDSDLNRVGQRGRRGDLLPRGLRRSCRTESHAI